MLPQEIIRIKRDKGVLSAQQVHDFVAGIVQGEVADEQVAAMTMAIFLNGLNTQETVDLTLAMRDSGEIMDWKGFDKPIVDKHSSGGVGDKVSLMLAPIMAACDVYVPMIAGRGLGHTGGTVDKLESIPNYNTLADNETFKRTVKNVGCAIIGQTGRLAPADKKIYAIRDVCSTVESIPLITASILSKKLAAGLQYLVMDLKCGNGAFMSNFADAKTLAQSIVKVANGAGTKTTAIITDMNEVLGRSVGNALEVLEAVDYLKNRHIDARLDAVTRALCTQLLIQCRRCSSQSEADALVAHVLESGLALEKFAQMVAALGGPADFAENPEAYLPHARFSKPIYAAQSGFVRSMDTRGIGLSIIKMRGGRTVPEQKLDLATGYTQFVQVGDQVDTQTPLAIVHYQSEEQYDVAKEDILRAVNIGDKQSAVLNPILLKI